MQTTTPPLANHERILRLNISKRTLNARCSPADIERLRRDTAVGRLGLSPASVYKRVAAGLIPPPISLGGRAVGWIASELDAVINARIAGKSDDEIRSLVAELVERRKRIA